MPRPNDRRQEFPELIDSDEAAEALRDDIRESRYRRIGRFPSTLIGREDGKAVFVNWIPAG